MDTDVYSYLRTHATELGSRILETYPPLQSTKDLVALPIATLLRKALPAQALEVTRSAEKTVGTFVGRLLQKGGQLWVVPTVSLGQKVLANH